jgi:hypothetical protein
VWDGYGMLCSALLKAEMFIAKMSARGIGWIEAPGLAHQIAWCTITRFIVSVARTQYSAFCVAIGYIITGRRKLK